MPLFNAQPSEKAITPRKETVKVPFSFANERLSFCTHYSQDAEGLEVRQKSKSKRRNTNESAFGSIATAATSNPLPVLPGDLWALIMADMHSHECEPAEYFALRTVEKSWAAATTQQSAPFWQRLSRKLLSAEVDPEIIAKHYCGSWYCFVRYWCAFILRP